MSTPSSMPAAPRNPRIDEYDGLRGLASLAVYGFHASPRAIPWGWAAVDLFFVLSGFLITAIILENKTAPRFLWSFYARRSLRIWPIYYLVLIALLLAGQSVSSAVPYYLTYTQFVPRYLGREMPEWELMRHTWSLAVEEQFYLVWPALLLIVPRRFVIALSSVMLAVSVGARRLGVDPQIALGRLDGLALGSILACLLANGELGRKRSLQAAIVALVGAITIAVYHKLAFSAFPIEFSSVDSTTKILAWNLVSFTVVTVCACYAGAWWMAPIRHPILVYLGKTSYGFYLYHGVVLTTAVTLTDSSGPYVGKGLLLGLFSLPITLALSAISWRWIEFPINALKRYMPYGPSVRPEL